ncbi:MAG: PEP/pyruvate-binding domain-containing protein [Nannocystaceae bacterium]
MDRILSWRGAVLPGLSFLLLAGANCIPTATSPVATAWACELPAGAERPAFAPQLGCMSDFVAVASDPASAAITGAQSVKTILDQLDGDALYFQDSQAYPIHWEFASEHLSGNGKPVVEALSAFNQNQYTASERRFLLGTVTYYAGPKIWAYEIAGLDTASPEMIERAYRRIAESAFFGKELYFHPLSLANELQAEALPADIRIMTTDEIYDGIDYHALNLAESVGRLRFVKAADLEAAYVTFQDIVVLDRVPNDISVVRGIITGEVQTPLSHINVLSKNRGTPNMSLRDAQQNEELLALKDKWVRLRVDALDYTIDEVSQEEADAWWEANKPPPLGVPKLDLSVKELLDIEDLVDVSDPAVLKLKIRDAIPAFGGKASHYAVLAQIDGMPTPKAFGIPIFYYRQFMEQNGFDLQVEALLADQEFLNEASVRDTKLGELRDAMKLAPVDADFDQLLLAKLNTDYPGTRMRFRSSTNAEDLEGFTGAGLYTSKSGDPNDPTAPVMDAVRKVWASVWRFRAFEERAYRGIDHTAVGMGILSHRSFPDEEANGVAITTNIFDSSGLDPAFYVNVQLGENSVVLPAPGVTTDQFLYYFDQANQPVVYLGSSNLTDEGEHVLTNAQIYALGTALKSVHTYFFKAYGTRPPNAADDWFYAMDVEFKFDGEPGEEPQLYVKQARPFGG